MEIENQKDLKEYLKELWHAFEMTGSIGAYLLYHDIREKAEKDGRIREKKLLYRDNAQ